MNTKKKKAMRSSGKPAYEGSDFDDFLREDGILDEVNEVARKRIVAFQIEREMQARKLTKVSLAQQLGTSRAQLDRVLDPNNTSITLNTLLKLAKIFGKQLELKFV